MNDATNRRGIRRDFHLLLFDCNAVIINNYLDFDFDFDFVGIIQLIRVKR
jgi:hypothetical protein